MITPEIIEEVKKRLITVYQPEMIYLFGSYARGTATDDSDLDLMVIVRDSNERPIRREQRAQRCLGRLLVSADVLVRTRKEVQRVQNVPGSLTGDVIRNGRKLYG